MNEAEAMEKYKNMGLKVTHEVDNPGKVYESHAHEGVYLFTLKGSVKVKLDNSNWQELLPGQEFIINKGQLHEAQVGPDGWEYIHAH